MSTDHPTTEHDTASTVAQIAKHLGFLNPTCEVHPAEDHDSLRDGNPVASVEVSNMLEVYPVEGTETLKGIVARTQPITRWAIDILVDDSDPSVGLYGCEPREHTLHDSVPEALQEIARVLCLEQVHQSLEVEAEAEQAAEMEEADKLAEQHWAEQGV